MLKRLTDRSERNERKGSVKAGGFGFGSFCRCKKTVECVACLLGRWNESRGIGMVVKTRREWRWKFKSGGFGRGRGRGRGSGRSRDGNERVQRDAM
ncbi:hypothetical protein Tco_1129693, partial [Tanacetum coccineum]